MAIAEMMLMIATTSKSSSKVKPLALRRWRIAAATVRRPTSRPVQHPDQRRGPRQLSIADLVRCIWLLSGSPTRGWYISVP